MTGGCFFCNGRMVQVGSDNEPWVCSSASCGEYRLTRSAYDLACQREDSLTVRHLDEIRRRKKVRPGEPITIERPDLEGALGLSMSC